MNKGKKIQLKKQFEYYGSTSFLIVNIIGAGIFVASTGVLKYFCMNVGLSLCIWAACALLSVMSTLSCRDRYNLPMQWTSLLFSQEIFWQLDILPEYLESLVPGARNSCQPRPPPY